jgi:hypothetical protein
MGFLILHGDPAFPTLPLLVFIFSKLSLLFGAIELGLSFTGQYESKEAV